MLECWLSTCADFLTFTSYLQHISLTLKSYACTCHIDSSFWLFMPHLYYSLSAIKCGLSSLWSLCRIFIFDMLPFRGYSTLFVGITQQMHILPTSFGMLKLLCVYVSSYKSSLVWCIWIMRKKLNSCMCWLWMILCMAPPFCPSSSLAAAWNRSRSTRMSSGVTAMDNSATNCRCNVRNLCGSRSCSDTLSCSGSLSSTPSIFDVDTTVPSLHVQSCNRMFAFSIKPCQNHFDWMTSSPRPLYDRRRLEMSCSKSSRTG